MQMVLWKMPGRNYQPGLFICYFVNKVRGKARPLLAASQMLDFLAEKHRDGSEHLRAAFLSPGLSRWCLAGPPQPPSTKALFCLMKAKVSWARSSGGMLRVLVSRCILTSLSP